MVEGSLVYFRVELRYAEEKLAIDHDRGKKTTKKAG